MAKFIKSPYFLLALIILVALALRLYKIDNPIADHHSWRQADTAAVTRNFISPETNLFIKESFNPLYPKIDNLTTNSDFNGPNPNRYFFTEFPLYNSMVAGLYTIFGIHEYLGRLMSVLFSLGTLVLIYFLAKKYFGIKTALFAAFFFAVLPFNVYFSRVFLPEPAMLFYSVGMIYFFSQWLSNEKKQSLFLLSMLFATLAVLTKPFTLFLFIPIFVIAWQKYGISMVKKYPLYLYLSFVLLAFLLWRTWAGLHPEGIPGFIWAFNQNDIRFRPAFFRWLVYERIDKLILAWGGLLLFALGIFVKLKKEYFVFYAWLAAIGLYFVVFAAGNVTHDYYQVPFIPIAVIFMALGANFLLETPFLVHPRSGLRHLGGVVLVLAVLAMLFFGWKNVIGFYDLKIGTDTGGQTVDRLTPKDALIITGDTADPTLLYNSNRHGWTTGFATNYPTNQKTIETLKKQGASFYVTTKVSDVTGGGEFAQYMQKNYKIVEQTLDYIVVDLR